MATTGRLGDWADSIVTDPEKRQLRFRKANGLEAFCASLAAICAIGAIWGFTADATVLGGIRSNAVGGIAVLCFSALMFLAAGAGIEKRFLVLVSELQKQYQQHDGKE
jgi:hypothetical protein